MSKSSISRKGFLGGILLGSLAGFVSAILIAPKAGKKIREEMRNQLDNVKSNIKKSLNLVGKEIKEFKENNKENLALLKLKARNCFERIRHNILGIFIDDETKSDMNRKGKLD